MWALGTILKGEQWGFSGPLPCYILDFLICCPFHAVTDAACALDIVLSEKTLSISAVINTTADFIVELSEGNLISPLSKFVSYLDPVLDKNKKSKLLIECEKRY